MLTEYTNKNRKDDSIPPAATSTWVREVLEPDQLATAKKNQRAGRRHLGLGTTIILWALRLYVIVMMFIIAYQIWTVIQS